MQSVLVGNHAAPGWTFWPPNRIRVVSWNIDRGLRLAEIKDFLAAQKPDIVILQEVDLYARRTGCRNIAEDIAKHIGMNYAFGFEFQELTQGRRDAPAYHGQATLSRWQLRNCRVIRFRKQSNFWRPRWFLPETEPFQERLGGRIALVSEVMVCGTPLVIYNLHLESRGNDALRISQLSETLSDTMKFPHGSPMLLAGDLNLDVDRSSWCSELQRLGFRSAISSPVPHTTTPRGILGRRRTIDWVYVAGQIEPKSVRVCTTVSASDHYPITFEFKCPAG
jgi:endonuclease/exonuclease/phosphatase family metal-dependent hydrolase